MKVAFYKGASSSGNGGLFDKLIRWWTGCPYSHVELAMYPMDGSDPNWWLCFSSSPRDGGVRFRPIWLDPKQWDLHDIHWAIDDAQARAIRDRAIQLIGLRYDWLGILGFVIRRGEHDKRRLFCSEAVVTACQAAGWFRGVQPWRTSPGGLAQMLRGEVDTLDFA